MGEHVDELCVFHLKIYFYLFLNLMNFCFSKTGDYYLEANEEDL